MKKWGIAVGTVMILGLLYVIEYSKINNTGEDQISTLDDLGSDNFGKTWDEFYRVRVEILDGQSARFNIPDRLKQKQDEIMELEGAVVFFSSACEDKGDKIAVRSFFLYPTLGLANACEHLPEVAMRWTILVDLQNDWLLTREEMIQARARVKGKFRIDLSRPYDAAFFLDDSSVGLIKTEE